MALRAIVLGSGAGGGVPQWNCNGPVSSLARAALHCGEVAAKVLPRTQASVAVSGDGITWTLLNASPDLRAQILATPALHPNETPRGSPIAAVILTGGEIDQITGLLTLRERHAFSIHATGATLATLAANPIFGVLASDLVMRSAVVLDQPFALPGGLTATLFTVPGKASLYAEGEDPVTDAETEDNVGVEVTDGARTLLFVPGCARITPTLHARLDRADAVLFDGTLFTDDEMIASGTGTKTGRRMGHMPMTGEGGSFAVLKELRGRAIYIHLNTTNHALVEGSPERRAIDASVEIAHDGMTIEV